jgi:hypothetical protein
MQLNCFKQTFIQDMLYLQLSDLSLAGLMKDILADLFGGLSFIGWMKDFSAVLFWRFVLHRLDEGHFIHSFF